MFWGDYASYIFRAKVKYSEVVVRLSVGKVDHRRGGKKIEPSMGQANL
jgi:hypothetical protein